MLTVARNFTWVAKKILWLSIIVLPLTGIATITVLYANNSLYLNGNWIVEKRMMQMGLMGADDFLLVRQPLAKNFLNLGSYFGFQQVLLRRLVEPAEIDFDFQISEDSYLDLIFNRNMTQFYGMRFSGNHRLPTSVFVSDLKGQILHRGPSRYLSLTQGWHHAHLLQTEKGILLSTDGEVSMQMDGVGFQAGLVGFGSGYGGAKIDNVRIRNSKGELSEFHFSNWVNSWQLFFYNLIAFGLLGLIFIEFPRKMRWESERHQFFSWIAYSAVGTICFIIWYTFDYYYYSHRIFQENGVTRRLYEVKDDTPRSLEQLRYGLFETWYGWTGIHSASYEGLRHQGYPLGRIFEGPIYCGPKIDKCRSSQDLSLQKGGLAEDSVYGYRVLFVGTSQTVGAGARTLEETFFSLIHRDLQIRLQGPAIIESINVSVSGSNSTLLFPAYRDQWVKLDPDLVIINLSNNDLPDDFEQGLRAFLDLNKSQGIKTLLVEEPTMAQPERNFEGLNQSKHLILQHLAKQYHLPIYPLHSYLNRAEIWSKGSLWWDTVHLTSYGQQLVAEALTPMILDELAGIPPRQHYPMVLEAAHTDDKGL